MINKMLFALIGVLMFSITGVGAAAAFSHPEEVTKIKTEIASKVDRVVSDTQDSVQRATGLTLASHKSESGETERNDDSGVASPSTTVRSHDSDDGSGEDENENEGGDDNSERGSQSTPTSTTPPVSTTPPATAQTFTLAQVAAHNSTASCYTAVNGFVYDVTPFISQHPGGSSAIKSLCGSDGSAAFNGQHGGQSRPASELASFKIGVLAH